MAGAASAPLNPASTARRLTLLFALFTWFPPYMQREGAKRGSGRRRLSAKLAICALVSLEKPQYLVTLAPYCGTAVGAGSRQV
jgi:hypothetical protein